MVHCSLWLLFNYSLVLPSSPSSIWPRAWTTHNHRTLIQIDFRSPYSLHSESDWLENFHQKQHELPSTSSPLSAADASHGLNVPTTCSPVVGPLLLAACVIRSVHVSGKWIRSWNRNAQQSNVIHWGDFAVDTFNSFYPSIRLCIHRRRGWVCHLSSCHSAGLSDTGWMWMGQTESPVTGKLF